MMTSASDDAALSATVCPPVFSAAATQKWTWKTPSKAWARSRRRDSDSGRRHLAEDDKRSTPVGAPALKASSASPRPGGASPIRTHLCGVVAPLHLERALSPASTASPSPPPPSELARVGVKLVHRRVSATPARPSTRLHHCPLGSGLGRRRGQTARPSLQYGRAHRRSGGILLEGGNVRAHRARLVDREHEVQLARGRLGPRLVVRLHRVVVGGLDRVGEHFVRMWFARFSGVAWLVCGGTTQSDHVTTTALLSLTGRQPSCAPRPRCANVHLDGHRRARPPTSSRRSAAATLDRRVCGLLGPRPANPGEGVCVSTEESAVLVRDPRRPADTPAQQAVRRFRVSAGALGADASQM